MVHFLSSKNWYLTGFRAILLPPSFPICPLPITTFHHSFIQSHIHTTLIRWLNHTPVSPHSIPLLLPISYWPYRLNPAFSGFPDMPDLNEQGVFHYPVSMSPFTNINNARFTDCIAFKAPFTDLYSSENIFPFQAHKWQAMFHPE